MNEHRLHASRVLHAIQSDEAARSGLVASWRRSCSLHRLDPAARTPPQRISDSELAHARQRMGRLIRAASASLDKLYLAVGGVGCCVLLADSDGIPVERRGAPCDDATFRSWGLWTGTLWGEDHEGTNGIGTCLVDGRALTIHRDEHFLTRNIGLSCTTAPIHDHEGRLVAALDVSSCRADLTQSFAGLIALAVGDAARRIEAEHFRSVFSQERILVVPGTEGGHALLAVDGDDLVVGASRAARLALGLDTERIAAGLPAIDLFGPAAGDAMEALEAERGVLQRALARAGGNVSEAARNLGVSRATLHRRMNRLGLRRPH
ncbi:GAF domain-containing protein [Aureimonas populi]|uniref:GAF domain-containing protein n=1 Tax=Aureimonas populi TaxID=1701758 RepID=A0ABW5CLC0_9HYPH|nr:GAF domain-containing protein [Aureimonas populi]